MNGGKAKYANDTPKCANDECIEPGVHQCARCRGVKYCSAACQKVHWKQGGHKQLCIPSPGPVKTASRAAGAGGRGGSHVGPCTICLDSDPPPIQSGCACRGDSGLAHVECRAEAAAHRMKNNCAIDGTCPVDGWHTCGTCKTFFTGAMKVGLAEAWWSRVQHLPEEDEQRLGAGTFLAISLAAEGKNAEAETVYRQVLSVKRRVLGPAHVNTLSTAGNLAIALHDQGKHAEAEPLYREVLAAKRRVLGSEHPNTLMSANNLAVALLSQGKLTEVEALQREALAVQQRVLGPEHPDTLMTSLNIASRLNMQGRHADAEALCRRVLVLQRRVLGPDHPDTLSTAEHLACSLREQGKYAEAERILLETIAAMVRVLGPKHETTIKTAASLYTCMCSAASITHSAS
jgi:hypothetical protein